jgi:cytidine deaminase
LTAILKFGSIQLETLMTDPKSPGTNRRSPLDEARVAQMVALAKEASKQAYSPYSKFPVGAAVLADSGKIYTGCNVENASYGLTICAERNAIFHAKCEGMKRILSVVVYTPTDKPSAPCGACRQVINEFGEGSRIICVCDGPMRIDLGLADLLPEAFGPGNLKTI